jgi:hypothetical protein
MNPKPLTGSNHFTTPITCVTSFSRVLNASTLVCIIPMICVTVLHHDDFGKRKISMLFMRLPLKFLTN